MLDVLIPRRRLSREERGSRMVRDRDGLVLLTYLLAGARRG